ncbi:hypothetical protein e112_233 [Escherichia phage vB_EcoM_112]|uniref:Uncharacterized protein n=1 Tax=Escherichia phage vB_EcoM_112 TaxID=1495285 RepID=A0A023ZUI2_9CAUD|nr:hypothetical protein e112_233 [Escherichia phage vB_EcoM_112]AHY83421.1 hypothetical protein e112_233 [Escherichia phage vB_EcoM_112]
MKTLLENYIKCSNNYIDSCQGAVYVDMDRGIVLNDEDPAKALDKAGKALSKAAKAKGVDIRELNEHIIIMFISANVSSKISNKEAAKDLVESRVQLLKILLGIK